MISRRSLETGTALLTGAFGAVVVVSSFGNGIGWSTAGVESGTFPFIVGLIILSGSIFNLVSLLLVGSASEQLWGSRRWLIIWFIGGVLSEIIAFAWQPVGAGNSVANFSLAASVAVLCLTRNPLRPARIAALLALGAGVSLLLLNDIHGAAAMLGAVIAIVLIWFDRRWLLKRV